MPLTILLADDSMTAQNLGKKILTEAGYDVVAVSNGAAAVKKIAEHKPDLAVLDVYMPGYTGLEVCERLKSAHETTGMPVLLTVGKMEPFKPEEGTRVKADGIIIKPFEASDLLGAIQKLEEKLNLKGTVVATPHDPNELPEYERTVKIPAPVFDEHDESYQTWKTEAPEHTDEPVGGVHVPTALAAAPVFGDELGAVAAAPAFEEKSAVSASTPPAETPTGLEELPTLAPAPEPEHTDTVRLSGSAADTLREFAKATGYDIPGIESETPAGFGPESATLPVGSLSTKPEELTAAAFEPTSAEPVEVESSSAPGFEPTSAPQAEEEHETGAAPGFEPTSAASGGEAMAHGDMDPGLITDVSEMSKEFPTKFGVEGAEPVHVGIASDFPELYQAPAASAGEQAPASWAAEETPLEDHEKSSLLHEEMQKHFAGAPGPTEEPSSPVEPAAIAATAPENGPDHELAAAMAAAVGAQIEPAVSQVVEQSGVAGAAPAEQHAAMIAEIVQRVTERIKPELVEQISRELAALKKKS